MKFKRYVAQSSNKRSWVYRDNLLVDVAKISRKMRKINWFNIEKTIIEWKKNLYYNYKKAFQFKKALLLIRESIRNLFWFLLMLKKFSLNKQKLWNFWSSGFATWFWRSNVLKYIFLGSNFLQKVLKCIFKRKFLKKKFWGSNFWNELFEGAIYWNVFFQGLIFWNVFVVGAIFL